jgi:tRNA1(Val) A37 N6-methylase TrmN6
VTYNPDSLFLKKTDEIYVLNKTVRLLQVTGGFRTSLDSVMLAAACPAKKHDHILDMGCGVGGAGFCVLRRVAGARLTGIDIQKDHVDLAKKNAALNKMKSRTNFLCADIRDYKSAGFDHVICNPPYLEAGTYTISPSSKKARALGHLEKDISLNDWINAAHKNLKPGGYFTIIHRADHTDKIIQAMGPRFGAVEIIPLWPRMGEAAKRVIIRARKGRKSPSIMYSGIVLHEKNGDYTKAADSVLRDMSSIVPQSFYN